MSLPCCASCGQPLRLRDHDGLYHVDCPALSDAQCERDRKGMTSCGACGHDPRPGDSLIIIGGYRIHESHTTDPQSGFYGAREAS